MMSVNYTTKADVDDNAMQKLKTAQEKGYLKIVRTVSDAQNDNINN